MKEGGFWAGWGRRLLRFRLVSLLIATTQAMAATEQTFELLQIGTRSYTNVTVTTKAKNYIFILHQGGMGNIKIGDLSPDLRAKLGYAVAGKTPTNSVANWAKQKVARLDSPKVKQLAQAWRTYAPAKLPDYRSIAPKVLFAVLVSTLFLYLCFAYCCMLICQKTGNKPGALVWVPVLQLLPLLRAAGMSSLWFLAYLVPVLNVVAQILWSVKIVQARGKGHWVTILLILPVTNLLAFLYLAFSSGRPPKKRERAPEIMTLEAA